MAKLTDFSVKARNIIADHIEEEEDAEFREQALDAVESLGIPEDEAEMLVDDYLAGY